MTAFGCSLLIAALLAYCLNWLALLPWRKASAGLFWTERAALLYPARASSALNFWLIILSLLCACLIVRPGSSPIAPAIGSLLGALGGTYPMTREIYPDLTFRVWLQIVASQLALGALGVLVIGGFALAMPGDFGWVTWLLLCLFLLIHFAVRLGLGIRLMRWLRILRKPPERLTRIVGEVAGDMGVSVRATWVMRSVASNAMAFTTTRDLAFTDRFLEQHPDDEVRAVCAHELGHLTEGRWILAARFTGGLWAIPLVLARPISARYGFEAVAIPVLVAWLIPLLLKRLFRGMEVRADGIAAAKVPDSIVYARALERMYRNNQMPAVMPSGRTRVHPDLYDRMTAVGAKPEYPRPLPPKSRSWTSWLLGTVAAVLAIVVYMS